MLKIIDFSEFSSGKRRAFFYLTGAFFAFLITAFILGISDNPPGIIFVFAAIMSLLIAFTLNWNTVKKFTFLTIAALVSFIVFVILHNLFYALGEMVGEGFLSYLISVFGALAFIIAVLICPPAFALGVIGSIVMFVRKRME